VDQENAMKEGFRRSAEKLWETARLKQKNQSRRQQHRKADFAGCQGSDFKASEPCRLKPDSALGF
jgi:hypothetical protein